MLIRPNSCSGCPLNTLAEGFMQPQLAGAGYKVALLGEALGEKEAEIGAPFQGPAGFKLNRLIEWAGLERSKFDIYNSAWCRPPKNLLEGQWYEKGAVSHCKEAHWARLLSRSSVVVPMGNVALNALVGRKGILSARGYIMEGQSGYLHILPTVHPSFIQRGQSKYSAAFIHDIQKAVELSRDGYRTEPKHYVIDPSPAQAYEWALKYRAVLLEESTNQSRPPTRLAYDIETPYKGDDEADLELDDTDGDGKDETYFIWRIGFSFEPLTALSIPWTPEYVPAIRTLLEGPGEKVVWNGGFDNPRIRYNGVAINGLIHDGMVAWHILHSDLPKGLAFVATFTCPFQSAWKHLSKQSPGYYNATDADVELRSFLKIEQELVKSGLWTVYQKDVLDLEPILIWMTQKGMPIDGKVREDRAVKLDEKIKLINKRFQEVVPAAILKKDIYETLKGPDDKTGCEQVSVIRPVKRCSQCGAISPTKPHFKVFKRPTVAKPQNPCAGAAVVINDEETTRWAWVEPFKPSRVQLMRYQGTLNRPTPTIYDKKTRTKKPSMGSKQLVVLMKKYPQDELYPLVIRYREADKVAGTYIGRPVLVKGKQD